MEQEFSLASETRGSTLIMTTSGYINATGGEAIAKEFSSHFEKGVKQVVINVGQSKVVNSIGMSFLIEIIDQLNDVEGKLIFTDVDPAVEKMLTIMGIFQLAGKEKSVDDALKTFAQ